MNTETMKALAHEIGNVMPWVQGISCDSQYNELIELMDELIEAPDENAILIDLLFPVIERYEEEAEQFQKFNKRIDELDQGIATLKVIIDQHGLTLSDFPEIGKKSLMSQILSGKRSLTLSHIRALSERFGVPASMFV
ncbi:helix-turn-helix domain-containing protein [Vibrio marisflavi]|uniref:Antitoxin HigA n=1 Tax=Vibrio marisflavi CECT 7928 TaxID=634439 RepID=A0ABM9AA26_9VIBR|nr:transcriptional regulator [Vibrio marisflavi]CAH0543028.1 Antitoxin HigA [Vibrio marisflavi CECT 7928]